MKTGDTVLLDGDKEVKITWKGGSLALVRPLDAPETQDASGVAISRLSEKGTIPSINDETIYDHDII